MSEVSVAGYMLSRQASNRQQLLALPAMRRSLEPESARWRATPPVAAVDVSTMNQDPHAISQDLAELIEAIDRRAPQLQRGGEAAIVDAARRLRVQAGARIVELEDMTRGGLTDPRRS